MTARVRRIPAVQRRASRAPGRLVTVAAGAALVLTGCSAIPSTSPVTEPAAFDTPLTIPPLAESRVAGDGTRVFELTAQEGTTAFLDGEETATWGFNGDHLGPTLRAKRGERVAVEVTNALDEPTSVHWHGMHLPAEMDGGPHQEIAPRATWRANWEIDQPAGTLWYHPHPHGATEKHVYRGLAGMFIVDDAASTALTLPDQYGVDDVPVIVQDKELDDDGQLVLEDDGNEVGTLGSTVMVNGTVGAYHEVTTERVRLRLLNGSTARTYAFGLDDDSTFQLLGTDGGLLEAPHQTNRVRLSPGERADIVITLIPGSSTMLRSYAPDLGSVAAPFAFGGEDSFDVLELRAAKRLAQSPEVPHTLVDRTDLEEHDAAVTRRFAISGREINGTRMDMNRIDEVVQVGSTEIWEVSATDLVPHNFHIHDVQFQVLSIDGDAPPPELSGSKDTIYLEPRRTYRLIMRFEDHADPDTPFMYHCHLLLHEDEGLMGQFVVTDRVGADGPRSPHDAGGSGVGRQPPHADAPTATRAGTHAH